MRVLHAIRSDGFAGVERHVARLARAQAATGTDVVVVGGRPSAMRAEMGEIPHRSARTLTDVWRAVRRLARERDVVHVHMTAAEVAAGLGLWGPGPAVVSTRHFARVRGSGPARTAVAAVARRRVARQIAISSYVAQHVDGSSTVVAPGIEPPSDDEQPRDRVVLVLQRLEPEKATDVALHAFARSGLESGGWRLVVAGSGTERPGLERLAAGLGIAPEFCGTRDDVPALLRSAGLLLAPCPVEGFGLSVLEAMAYRLPVVAADAGGHGELLGGLDDRALFPAGDASAAARQLTALALDPSGRAAYGAAAGDRCRTSYTLTAQVEATDAVYRSVT